MTPLLLSNPPLEQPFFSRGLCNSVLKDPPLAATTWCLGSAKIFFLTLRGILSVSNWKEWLEMIVAQVLDHNLFFATAMASTLLPWIIEHYKCILRWISSEKAENGMPVILSRQKVCFCDLALAFGVQILQLHPHGLGIYIFKFQTLGQRKNQTIVSNSGGFSWHIAFAIHRHNLSCHINGALRYVGHMVSIWSIRMLDTGTVPMERTCLFPKWRDVKRRSLSKISVQQYASCLLQENGI